MLTRRKTIALLGGGAILAAGGAGGYSVTRKPQLALAPWEHAGTYTEPRMKALSYAILAPNPHNKQPWLVDLRQPNEVTLTVDLNRLLPHTDPFNRQIVIGLGCFLEVMALAAAADGFRVELDLFPDGEDQRALDQRRVAVARFLPGQGTPEPALFDHVLQRRSLKVPYDLERPVENAVLQSLAAAVVKGSTVGTTNIKTDVDALREMTTQALEVELRTPRTYKESVDLFRIGHREVDANPDGIDFSGVQFETLRLFGLFSRAGALDPGGMSFQAGIDLVNANARSGKAYVWLTTAGNSRTEQIQAGRDWVRLNLAATAMGLGVQPMSQPLQEYPEMKKHYDDVHARLAPDGAIVQMLGRLGYGKMTPPSPRWHIDQKVTNA